jgi:hypothetical protein
MPDIHLLQSPASHIASITKGDILFSSLSNEIVIIDNIMPFDRNAVIISTTVLKTGEKSNIFSGPADLSFFRKPSHEDVIKSLTIFTENQIRDKTKQIRELKTEIRKHKRNLTNLSKLSSEEDIRSFIIENLV